MARTADPRSRVGRIKAWLDENAEWIEAAPNVQLVFDCAGAEVKVRTGQVQRISDGADRMSA